MFQMFKQFYQQHGVRHSDKLIAPMPFRLTIFPRDALFHATPQISNTPDVDSGQPYFQGYSKKILVENVTDYVKMEGAVRTPSFNLPTLTQGFRQKNKSNWQIVDTPYLTEKNASVLVVENYGYLDVVHKYAPVQLSPYFQWLNRQRTVWAKVAEIAKISNRNQFLIFPIAPVLQGKSILDRFSKMPVSTQMVSILGGSGEAGYMQLDLWKWLSVIHRSESLIGQVDPAHYGKVNLVFQSGIGKQLLVNLGYLNSWIKGQPNLTEFGAVAQFDAEFVQKLFLKMSMSLNDMVQEEADVEVPLPEPITSKPRVEPGKSEEVEKDDDSDNPEAELDDALMEKSVGEAELHRDLTSSTKLKSADELDQPDQKLARGIATSDIMHAMMADVEKDIEALDHVNLMQLKNSGKTLKAEVPEAEAAAPVIDPEVVKARVYGNVGSADRLKGWLHTDAEANLITAADYRKMTQAIDAFQNSPDPYGSKQPRIKAMVITPEDEFLSPEDSAIVTSDSVPDKTMASSSLKSMDSKYLSHVHKKDVLRAIDAIQSAGVVVRNHEVDIGHSVLGSYEQHTLELKPVDGSPSSIKFTLPIVEDDGTFMAGGNKYLMRKQRVDVPIRKIAPRIVALSTYYGKTFVQTNTKVSNDSLSWLFRQINLAALSQGGYIHDVSPGNVYDHDFKCPYLYGALSQEYSQFMVGTNTLFFDRVLRAKVVAPEVLKAIEKNGRILCGWTKDKKPIVLDTKDQFIQIDGSAETILGTVYDFFQLDQAKAPIDFSEVRIFSKYVPVGVALGYYLGFSSLIALLGETYRIVPARKNKQLEKGEYAITFKDESYVFKTTNRVATLILSGFLDFDKVTKIYDRVEFETKGVYLNLLLSKKIGAIYVRELDMLENAFVDPISREILEEMHEPVTFSGLMVRGTELLTNYSHPASQDRAVMRDRGYERFAGAIYKETMHAVRQFRNKNLIGRSKVDMSPYQVWNAIMKDNSLKIVEDTNPIQNLKESEVITYAGTGGRDKETMTKPSRAYHRNDIGVLSESTVDSSSVGTIAYLSANPNISNVRGMMSKDKVLNPTSIMSTSALISPCSSHDKPKRIMFIATQHSHTIASPAYRQPYVRTGYEFVIGKRTSKMFSTAATEDGKVTGREARGLIVTYKSGKQVGIELGRLYGKAEGTTYPHDIVSPLKVGDTFKNGDVLAYNNKFFEPDFINPKEIILKVNEAVTTAMVEGNQTHEDSCSISAKIGQKFQTEVTKVKSFVIRFEQNLVAVRKPGDELGPKDILMIIEDEITANSGAFSEDDLQTLRRLSNVAPKAGVLGTLEKIEVFYHGDKADMSPTLKKLADRSDAILSETAKATNRPVVTGRVTEEYRVSGTPLEMDQAEVRFYMSVQAGTGVGDKVVFSHQMKCTVSEVQRGEIHTEEGEEVDALFSYRSVAARGVLSPAELGTTITLLDAASKMAADLYFGKA